MFYSYVLKSLKDGKYYYGHTANLKLRLDIHNKGKIKSTKSRTPFILHYYETFETKVEAAKREFFFKSINGYVFLKREQNHLITPGSGFSRRDSVGGAPSATQKNPIAGVLFYVLLLRVKKD